MRKQIPILFSTPMVQAILAGRKTQTRRVIKPQPDENGVSYMKNPPLNWEIIYKESWKPYKWDTDEGESIAKECPFGDPGDLLWVRETMDQDFENGVTYIADNSSWDSPPDYCYRSGNCKVPPIHMPKAAARIWLEVTNVRAERLQDISEEDAKAEGVERWTEERMRSKPTHYKVYCDLYSPNDPAMYSSDAVHSFETLWHLIHGLESWEANPWVWVVEFKVLSTTGYLSINA